MTAHEEMVITRQEDETERNRILLAGHGDIITDEDFEAWEKRVKEMETPAVTT